MLQGTNTSRALSIELTLGKEQILYRAAEKGLGREFKFTGKDETKRQLGRQRRKWKTNIKFDHCEIK
jgi:hypothetical protein